jgi:hypothetical protein
MKIATRVHSTGLNWNAPLPGQCDGPGTLVLAFGSPDYPGLTEAIQELRTAFPGSVLAGCSTAGEILGGTVRDDTLSVAVLQFERTAVLRASTTLSGPAESEQAGARLAAQLARDDLRAVLVLSDGIHVNGAALVAGLNRALPRGVAVSGGLAGDAGRFRETWVLDGDERRSSAVVAVGLYGSALRVGLGSAGGWSDFGPERRITRAEGQVLYELDGKPALELYRAYLGELAAGLPAAALRFPLSVRQNDRADESLVRTILGIDEQAQTLTFAGDIPEGGVARLMRANPSHLVDSAEQATSTALAGAGALPASEPTLVLSVSCVGRRMVLGEHTEEELESALDGLPEGSAQIGFYSYGEISPAGGCESRLHNQTMTVTALYEAAA